MSEPPTPLHPQADEQLDLNAVKELDENDIEGLDLNPDLEDMQISVPEEEEVHSDSKMPTFKRSYIEEDEDEDMFDNVDDFKPRINIDSPFSSHTRLSELQPQSERPIGGQRRLSCSQQSKFITYCDDRVMEITRKFVQSRGLNAQNGYSGLSPLLQDLKSLVDFIWYSVEGTPNTEYLLVQDPADVTLDQFVDCKSTYFGQSAYLIKIADDLIDYTEKFELASLSSDDQNSILSKLFKLLLILDKIFARLLDGTIPGKVKMSTTDSVRLTGIAERTRARLPRYLEQQNIHGYHYEVSKIYEHALERCGN